MANQEVTFDQWLAMSDDERSRLEDEWDAYDVGYWHGLRREAEARFKKEFEDHPHIAEVHGGLYHGGALIIGVTVGLPDGEKVKDIPGKYLGFDVRQFWVPGEDRCATPGTCRLSRARTRSESFSRCVNSQEPCSERPSRMLPTQATVIIDLEGMEPGGEYRFSVPTQPKIKLKPEVTAEAEAEEHETISAPPAEELKPVPCALCQDRKSRFSWKGIRRPDCVACCWAHRSPDGKVERIPSASRKAREMIGTFSDLEPGHVVGFINGYHSDYSIGNLVVFRSERDFLRWHEFPEQRDQVKPVFCGKRLSLLDELN